MARKNSHNLYIHSSSKALADNESYKHNLILVITGFPP